MLELYYNCFTKICEINNFEELKIITELLYLALVRKELDDCIRPEMKREGQGLRSNDCVDSSTAEPVAIFFPRTRSVELEQHDKREHGLFKEEFRITKMLCLCTKTYCCYDVTPNYPKFSWCALNRRVLKQGGDRPREKCRRVLNRKVNVSSNKRVFRTKITLLLSMNKLRKIRPTLIQRD